MIGQYIHFFFFFAQSSYNLFFIFFLLLLSDTPNVGKSVCVGFSRIESDKAIVSIQ